MHMAPLRSTGTPPLTRFFGPGKKRVKGKPRYRRSILVLKPKKVFSKIGMAFNTECLPKKIGNNNEKKNR